MWQVFSYWMIPTASAIIWFTTLNALLGAFIVFPPHDHLNSTIPARPPYPSMASQFHSVPYVSDIGATKEMQPIFIIGCVLTTFLLAGCFVAERTLRHKGRLARNTDKTERVVAYLSIVSAVVGSVGLIFLSIFDVFRFRTIHNIMVGLFISGYAFSAFCQFWEHYRMGCKYRDTHANLMVSAYTKLAFLALEGILGLAYWYVFIAKNWDAGAAIEWAVSYVFCFYILSYLFDFLPALSTKDKDCRFGVYTEECMVQVNGRRKQAVVQNFRGVAPG
ncbi:uncharacterized protein EAF02_002941 [Botrytis sinoallii]|uniref:uncharacterized protein n=1 Tax=Botrytis sinoallii TaxID=1463999 RepID=UPI001901FA86|nr:uncharacterized protein EAF02_002941 [Botrytis sinoallii]KAF7888400.1 hypothetical protein EAF02_002941 [Botrytis sinoallii]